MPEPAGEPQSGRRRRWSALGAPLVLALVPVLTGTLLLGAAAPATAAGQAAAGPPTASAPAPPAPTRLCQLADPRLEELSGLVNAGGKLLAMHDGGARLELYVLDTSCRVTDVRTAAVDPYDPEDLALGGDGTIWFADIGDNRASRATVALLGMRPNGSTAVLRLRYPDGAHDAEALLLAPDGTPYLVTKELSGVSGVYRPESPAAEDRTTALTKVATVHLTATGTAGGPVGPAGQLLVTGGAVSRDGKYVALRTYTDAYVWPLTGSDVAAALGTPPRRVALPAEPQGEAIAITEDDAWLVVGGERLPNDIDLVPLPAAAPPPAVPPAVKAGVPTLNAALIAAGVATVLVWLAGVVRRRRRGSRPAG